jgi:hypothetical protein
VLRPYLKGLADPQTCEVTHAALPDDALEELQHARRMIENHWDPVGVAEPVMSVISDKLASGVVSLLKLHPEQSYPQTEPASGGAGSRWGELFRKFGRGRAH